MSKKKQRVAFLLGEFPVLTETFILNQLIFLLDRKIDVKIFALYPGRFDLLHSQYLPYKLETRVTFIATTSKNPYYRLKELFAFVAKHDFFVNIVSVLRCLNPFKLGIRTFSLANAIFYTRLSPVKEFDLVHAHFGETAAFFSRFKSIGLFQNTPLLVSFHGFDLIPSKIDAYRSSYKVLFDHASLITVNSEYTRSILEKVTGPDRFQFHILPVGLDTSLFRPLPSQEVAKAKWRVVFCGRLEYWKGPDIALDIARVLKWEQGIDDFELLIIGSGTQVDFLRQKVTEDRLEKHVFLLGSLDQKELIDILGRSDIFLFPGRKDPANGRAENQGLVLQEAQAMGVPVVAADVGGIRFGILPDVSGYLIAEGDIEGFVFRIKDLFYDKARRESLGEAGREYVVENFDNQVLGERLLKLYELAIE